MNDEKERIDPKKIQKELKKQEGTEVELEKIRDVMIKIIILQYQLDRRCNNTNLEKN